eukprot:TRINITY_DN8696_c0_g1_i2.p1 TRINITY_DN8696_c0_g1~~TRINITY_DN8696_c0_g1_i2.p1  ORF type:complete len:127 (+),score=37.38 TRINITY_DN8696_c0_g1_i2:52-432(+)
MSIPEYEVVSKQKLQDMLNQIAPGMAFDPEVEDYLMDVADDFIESVTTFSADLAKHRNSKTLDLKDVQFHLEKNCGIRIAGAGLQQDLRLISKNENAMKQRMEQVKQAQELHGPAKKIKIEDTMKE